MPYPKSPKHRELTPKELRWRCDPKKFKFRSTATIEPIEGIFGQDRALRAIELGVGIQCSGYNIFIAGLSGTGKATTVKKVLESLNSNHKPLLDYVYVNNFNDPDQPMLLTFPAGKAKKFKKDLNTGVQLLRKKIPSSLDTGVFNKRKNKIIDEFKEKEGELINEFEGKIKNDHFIIEEVQVGEATKQDLFYQKENKSFSLDQLEVQVHSGELKEKEYQDISKKYNSYMLELQVVYKKSLKITQDYQEKINRLERETAEVIIDSVIEGLKENYNDKKITEYLAQLKKHTLENLSIFLDLNEENERIIKAYLDIYDANIILDNSETKSSPIIIENFPNYTNLFGTIEKKNDGKGGYYSDFSSIKAGSLLRANGGFLVLNVNHILEEPGVWKNLKRVLVYNKLEIQDPYSYFQVAPISLKPEPINIDFKVILMGSQYIYSMLSEYEYDFKKIFKVKADFDYEVKWNDQILVDYARVIKKLIKQENLLEFDKSAIAYLIELSARFSGRKSKLTIRFSKISDLAKEASYWAKRENASVVKAMHVEKAYNEAKARHGMLENKMNEMFSEETILIDTDGERVGQINGLAVYTNDMYAFGRPTRITSTVSLGSGSIINVEREAGMSGRHYNKGVLIISGYFREMFGQDLPLSFNANLVFEQSYGTVDGDSASCAEIFALLSTLSGLPIKQGIAVTGSLNQKGDVQPIGGVNEKIEGFFEICKMNGLTKKQGVIIPNKNVNDLMLSYEVVDAVKKGLFHIYPIEKVEQGIEILTGVKAGDPMEHPYEENSVYDLVVKKIKDLYAKTRSIKNPTEPKSKIIKKKKKIS